MDVVTNLKAFMEVARTASFSAAARRLNVATSVVTKRIEQLESKTGARLFNRTTRKVVLSEAGRRFLPLADRICAELDEALARMHELPQRIEGPLRLKMPTTLTAFYLADMLARFQGLHPNVTMEILVVDRAVDPLREGFDMALTMFAASFGGVVNVDLCPVRRLLAAAPAYLAAKGTPRNPSELTSHNTLNFQPLGESWAFESSKGQVSVTVLPRLNSNDGQVLLSSALRGNGIVLLSSYIVQPAIDDGRLVPLLPDFPVPDFWIRALVPEDRLRFARVQALLDFLRAQLLPTPPWERAADALTAAGLHRVALDPVALQVAPTGAA